MARNPFSSGLGLFGGETFADVGRAMRQEDELAALRAQKQAPDYFSGIIAKANEQMGRNACFIKSEYLPEDFEYDTSHITKWLEDYKKESNNKNWIDVS